MADFNSLGLDNWILKLCEKINYVRPTKIQKLVIPTVLAGKNVIANSETGSGKTASFSFPILQKLSKDPYGVFAIILTPNRELAFQITEQLTVFGVSLSLRCATIVGGADMLRQNHEIDRIPHVIVATPGRLLHLLETNSALRSMVQNVQFLVLDEVDRLVEETVFPDIEAIIGYLPKQRQNILTSATVGDNFSKEYLKIIDQSEEPEYTFLKANDQMKTVAGLKQKYIFIPEMVKDFYFYHLITRYSEISIMIFVGTCRKCHILYLLLKQLGVDAVCLHSLLSQRQRLSNLGKFRNSKSKILLATDVASRGLDIPVVDLVINFDIPRDPTDYIHRVGRTARKGKRGLAISIVTQHEVRLILSIEEKIGEKLENFELNENEVLENMRKVTRAKKMVKIKMYENGVADNFDRESKARSSYKKKLRELKKFSSVKIKPEENN